MELVTLYVKGVKSQAALFFIEGELMNVIVKDPERFQLGDSIVCFIDSNRFETKIIRKHNFNLYLYIPWVKEFFGLHRRRAARSEFHAPVTVYKQENPADGEILDISIMGLAISCEEKLNIEQTYPIEFYIYDQINKLQLTVKNELPHPGKNRYGGIFQDATFDDLFHIRKFVLNSQIKRLSISEEKFNTAE